MSARARSVFLVSLHCLLTSVAAVRAEHAPARSPARSPTTPARRCPGVTVTATNAATGVTRTTVTEADGAYSARRCCRRGTYEVDGRARRLPARPSPATSPSTSAATSTHQADDAGRRRGDHHRHRRRAARRDDAVARSARSSTRRYIENLPVNGRNFIDFVLTTPGVVKDVRVGDISFAGQRGTLNSLVIDGANNDNTFFGQSLGRTGSGRAPYQFSQDAVKEFQVNSNAYSAEYGRAGGAVINVVTKSGTNDFDGTRSTSSATRTTTRTTTSTRSTTARRARTTSISTA